MTSQMFIELQRQKEIIEQWLNTPGIPADAHARLLEMLNEVNEETISLLTPCQRLKGTRRRLATP